MIKLTKEKLLRFNLGKIKNKKVLVRVDFNVDLKNGKIFDLYRIEAVKPIIKMLQNAERVIFISHWQDPEKKDPKYSLKKLLPQIQKILEIKLGFLEDLKSTSKEKFNLLENIRFWKGEKENDQNFVNELKKLGEIFVNEAFSASHRKHASIFGLSKVLPTYFGPLFEKEINLMNKALKPKKPLMLILGGAKISTKLPLIYNFLPKADLIFLAGGLANTFLKAKGFEVGKSLVEESEIPKLKSLFNVKIFLPLDFIVQNGKKRYLGEVKKNEKILDIGQETIKTIKLILKNARTIVWNGPLGYVEKRMFRQGTKSLAKFLSQHKGFVLVGGGDTLAFLSEEKLLSKFKNISTGGGAMLHYLANGTLPIFE